MTREQAAQAITDLLSERVGIDHDVDPSNLEYGMDIDTFERLEDVERSINEQSDIIYYSRAMEFLSREDPSLTEAFKYAAEMGYDLKDLNSEVLASILNNRQMYDIYWSIRDEIEEILDDIDDLDEEEDIEGMYRH